jgi:aspartyl/asparaginyl beta-hydroxylase (cupin superfamily)
MNRLFAPQFLVVWAFIGSVITVHFRGKVKLGFWRQVSDHSTIMAPYNCLMYLFSTASSCSRRCCPNSQRSATIGW